MKLSPIVKFTTFLVILILLECIGVGYLGVWREGFWQAVETKNTNIFIWKLGEFTTVALILCFISGYSQFLIQKISMLWRTKLTIRSVSKPFNNVEGGAQRVQEDCLNYPLYGLTLASGLLRSIINLITFIAIVFIQLGMTYLYLPILYTLIGTLVAYKLARPLINLNYVQQCVEAKFRFYLSLLLKPSSDPEECLIDVGYSQCNENFMNLATQTKKLQYFQSFYNQITVLVPYVIIAPLYFSSKILFGTFMQVASAMNHVIESMSYIINSYGMINNWLSCRRRLKELGVLK